MMRKIFLVCAALVVLLLVFGRRRDSSANFEQLAETTDSAGSVEQGATSVTAKTFAYPLKLSENRRYLVDQNGKPFRIQGDSAQSLIANLTYKEAETYLADRQAKGFDAININLIEHKFAVKAPANRNGDAPFKKPDDFSTPNEAYFAFADSIIDLAASKGMLVSLAPMYLGYDGGDEGWWKALTNDVNTREVCYRFGLYIGKRYKDRKNILWVIGGDYLPPAGSEGEARLHSFLEGIKAAGAKQLWAGDWNAPCISTTERAFADLMDVNAVYTAAEQTKRGAGYEESRIAYNDEPVRPAYLKETGYEDEGWTPGDRTSVRGYEYAAILGGATSGGFFGNRDIWEFATSQWWSGFKFGHRPWREALDTPGVYDMARLGQLLDSAPWYDLVPSGSRGMRPLIQSGGGVEGQPRYIVAAATRDGRALLAYVPASRAESEPFSVNLAVLRNPVHAEWFDPTSGKYAPIGGDPFGNAGAKSFKVPGTNSAGATDWVLVLRAE